MLLKNNCIGTIWRMGGCRAYLAEFLDAWTDMLCYNHEHLCRPGQYIHYPRPHPDSTHHVARNHMAIAFRGPWLIMLDSDHAPEPDICGRLVRAAKEYGVDVISALYHYTEPPFMPKAYQMVGSKLSGLTNWDADVKAVQLDATGAGCLFIRRNVFDALREQLPGEKPFDRMISEGFDGEDTSFFQRLKRLGIPMLLSTRIECPHLRVSTVTDEMRQPGMVDVVNDVLTTVKD